MTSTSLSSRGAMNSNETLGLLRASMSAIRMVSGSLPQQAGVTDAARHALGVEIFKQRQHRATARAQPVAQLGHGDRTADGHELFHHGDRRFVSLPRERDVVT